MIDPGQAPKGLSEEIVKFISRNENESASMLELVKAYRRGLTMQDLTWGRVDCLKLDFQDLCSCAAPKPKKAVASLDEIDPEILKTYEKLGISLREVAMLRKESSRSPGRKMPRAERSRAMRSSIRSQLRLPSRRS
ncbi:hypothetical protein [Bradyrhizobium centrosematis]|uniref:hypothetical protein n=1 Tax=Bradyrhizobium centrosematis TaxID=1300039 RepID=UPI003890C780